MTNTPAQPAAATPRAHLVLFDGVCGLCHGLVRFVLARDGTARFRFAPLQSETGRAVVRRHGGDPSQLHTMYVVTRFGTCSARVLTKGRAALFVARELGWPWRMFGVLQLLPNWLLDSLYDVVAATRYRLFGRYDVCPMPNPEFRNRFID